MGERALQDLLVQGNFLGGSGEGGWRERLLQDAFVQGGLKVQLLGVIAEEAWEKGARAGGTGEGTRGNMYWEVI